MKKWKDRNDNEKKFFLIKVIGTILFLGGGLAFALVSASINGWDITRIVQDPRAWLGILCGVGLIVMLFSFKKFKR